MFSMFWRQLLRNKEFRLDRLVRIRMVGGAEFLATITEIGEEAGYMVIELTKDDPSYGYFDLTCINTEHITSVQIFSEDD